MVAKYQISLAFLRHPDHFQTTDFKRAAVPEVHHANQIVLKTAGNQGDF
ncbi:hypothetical protein predicted by Glimmer/Critica [Acetobacter senegalensis]|uniref:Uncharacterized protein n=1 Tax=Acetobacter senegalensis TaxID=446692 RepID=A0A0U5EU37_9PROT|nr:hypothetical protein predicted by Glimmer/Critica [Acetobacter senegalensis]